MKGVQGYTSLDEGIYEVKTELNTDIRSEIFSLAAKYNWPLVGLQQVESSLEDVFKQLTLKEVEK